MNCLSVRFRTFPLKHMHCGNAVTPSKAAGGHVAIVGIISSAVLTLHVLPRLCHLFRKDS
jgi:hypothetical protein